MNAQQARLEGDADERLANGLGWFSVGLGLAELVAPDAVAKFIGLGNEEDNRALLRFYGVRELTAGIGILSQPRPATWVWSRVAGDLMDLASLGNAMSSNRNDRGRLATATAAVVGVTALDLLCAQNLSQKPGTGQPARSGHRPVLQTITVNRSPDEVYRYWREFQNFPSFMKHLESVEVVGDRRSHWKAKGPAGYRTEWDAEITDDRPGSFISWRSLEGSEIDNSGSVRFLPAPGGRGTIVRVELQYKPLAGAVGAGIAMLFGQEPSQQVADDLRAFKQIIELGEVVKSDASIHTGMHAAQPSLVEGR